MAQSCYFLTEDELASMLDDGYTLIGGPYDSEDDCDAVCSSGDSGSGDSGSGDSGSGDSGSSGDSGGSGIPCECDPLPDTLTITASSSCDCINGAVWFLTYDSDLPFTCTGDGWTGSTSVCDQTFGVTLACCDGVYILYIVGTIEMNVNSCDPLQLIGNWTDSENALGCGSSTIVTFTIT